MFLFNSDGSTFSSDKEGDGFKYLLNINTTGVCPGRESATLLNSSITMFTIRSTTFLDNITVYPKKRADTCLTALLYDTGEGLIHA